MLVIVKMDVTEEPGVSKLPSGTVEPLRAPEVSTLEGENKAVIYCTSSSSDYLMIWLQVYEVSCYSSMADSTAARAQENNARRVRPDTNL